MRNWSVRQHEHDHGETVRDGLNEMQLAELNVLRIINELTAPVIAYRWVEQESVGRTDEFSKIHFLRDVNVSSLFLSR